MAMRYLLAFLLVILLLAPGALACKDIIALNEATAGDYHLLLKVRDPSRPGLQVLWKVDRGYQYEYHTPWTGRPVSHTVQHAFLGVATQGDVPPNVFKAGMALSDAGIAYGDADLPSYWINPSPYAWDDFDWIRYACQSAGTEKEAVDLLIEAVDMHAPGVPENLFVVGPRTGYVMEATAYHYHLEEVQSLALRSNYPRELWDSMVLKNVFVASSFDRVFEGAVRPGRAVRLGATMGIRVLAVDDDRVVVRQMPLGGRVTIPEGEGAMVGFYWVEALDCGGNTARLRVSYRYHAWEEEMYGRVAAAAGSITPADMMAWSRLHSSDLGGMRGMCEAEEKAAMVFKIPRQDYHLFSMGWFAPDQCAAIFVPVHIVDTDILPAYRNGMAAESARTLLHKFGHGNLTSDCTRVESVFLHENQAVETVASGHEAEQVAAILTASDVEMQRQAVLMQNIFLSAQEAEREMAAGAWNGSYRQTLLAVREALDEVQSVETRRLLAEVAASIAGGRLEVASLTGKSVGQNSYREGQKALDQGQYARAVDQFIDTYEDAQRALFGRPPSSGISAGQRRIDLVAAAMGIAVAALLVLYMARRR